MYNQNNFIIFNLGYVKFEQFRLYFFPVLLCDIKNKAKTNKKQTKTNEQKNIKING